jgi:uncharacterized membrane protein
MLRIVVVVAELVEWIFGTPSEGQSRRAARSLLMFVGALIGILVGSATHADLIALRAMRRGGFELSISTLLVATCANVAVLCFFLAVGGYGGFLIGEAIDEHASPARQLQIFYLNRIACLSLSLAGIGWAVQAADQGGLSALVCVLAAMLFLIATICIIAPLRVRFGTRFSTSSAPNSNRPEG